MNLRIDWLTHIYKVKTKDLKTKKIVEKPLSNGSISTYISNFSNGLNSAVRAEKLGENPFMLLSPHERVKKSESQRAFLTIEELKCMIATECSNELVKCAYLFSCYCGLRISDILKLRWSEVICNDGKYTLSVVMKKTSRPIYIPLSKNAMMWMPERKDDSGDTLVFAGLPTKTTINKVLKEWAAAAKIGKKITYHTSRHTFGTLMLTVGADLYTTSKLMGHSEVRTTQIYAKIVDSKKIEAINKVDQWLGAIGD